MNDVKRHSIGMLIVGGFVWLMYLGYCNLMTLVFGQSHFVGEVTGIPLSWVANYGLNTVFNFRQPLDVRRFFAFCVISGIGWMFFLLTTYVCTDVLGWHASVGPVIGVFSKTAMNVVMQQAITFGYMGEQRKEEGQHKAEIAPDYDWRAYYNGNPIQKYWKRQISQKAIAMIGVDNPVLEVGCFPAGTKVVVKGKVARTYNCKSGKYTAWLQRGIETLKVGDEVLSYNSRTGKKEWDAITEVFSRDADKLLTVRLDNSNELTCTEEHPIAIFGKAGIRWMAARNLSEGDSVLQYWDNSLRLRLRNFNTRGKSWGGICSDKDRLGKNKKQKRRLMLGNTFRSGISPAQKGMTYEEYYGKNAAKARKDLCSRPMTPELRKKLSDSQLGRSNPEHSKLMRERWSDPKYAKRMYKRQHKNPTSIETKMSYLLRSTLPGEYKYNGDGRLGLYFDGFAPDFPNVNGKKKVIEVFGCAFHCCPHCGILHSPRNEDAIVVREKDEKRLSRIRKLGNEVLVIWEHELNNNVDDVKVKVRDFTYNPFTKIAKVSSIVRVRPNSTARVYNIHTRHNNNYFAYGVLVHNCGSSPNLSMLPVKEKVGLEPDAGKVEFMQHKDTTSRYAQGVGESMPDIADGHFSAVMCLEVIEHHPHPYELVKEIARVTKDGGKVVLATPDFSSPLWNVIEVGYGLLMKRGYHLEHGMKFTESAVKALCEGVVGADLVMEFRKV